MYELRGGTDRLQNAMWSIADDNYKMEQLAHVLNYDKRQLKQDIQAVHDYYVQHEAADRESTSGNPWADDDDY